MGHQAVTWQAEREKVAELAARVTLLYATDQVTPDEMEWLAKQMRQGALLSADLTPENAEERRQSMRAVLTKMGAKVAGIEARAMVGQS